MNDLRSPILDFFLVVREQQEIIHVAEIAFAVEFPFDKVIEGIEKTIRPKLTGEITNGQAARSYS